MKEAAKGVQAAAPAKPKRHTAKERAEAAKVGHGLYTPTLPLLETNSCNALTLLLL